MYKISVTISCNLILPWFCMLYSDFSKYLDLLFTPGYHVFVMIKAVQQ